MKSYIKTIIAPAACILFVVFLAIAVGKTVTMWKYVDSSGSPHYVDEAYKVPEKYRAKAVKVEIEIAEPQVSNEPPPPPPTSNQTPKQIEEERLKLEWKSKARNAVERAKFYDNAVKEKEPECNALQRKWETMPSIENAQALEGCVANWAAMQTELTKAIEYRDKGLLQEAMRAGVPIDWIYYILKGKEE